MYIHRIYIYIYLIQNVVQYNVDHYPKLPRRTLQGPFTGPV